MTSKKSTSSGAQHSTSARTKKQPARAGRPKGEGKGSASDKLTAERIRTILSDPSTGERGKARIRKLVRELYEAGEWDTLPETPEFFGLLFEQTYINDHIARGTAEPAERDIYAKLADAFDRHEPKDARLVRRLSEVVADEKREDDRMTLLDALNNLSNYAYGVSDFHPDIFPTYARVILRESRKYKGKYARQIRESIRRVEAIAGE